MIRWTMLYKFETDQSLPFENFEKAGVCVVKQIGEEKNNAVWDGCRGVSFKWVDGLDWKSPGGVKYRAA